MILPSPDFQAVCIAWMMGYVLGSQPEQYFAFQIIIMKIAVLLNEYVFDPATLNPVWF